MKKYLAVAAAVAAGVVAWRRSSAAAPPSQDLWAVATDPIAPAR
jgi:hypothetical protein